MKRRILSMLLLVVMFASLFPSQAFAENTTADNSAQAEPEYKEPTEETSLNPETPAEPESETETEAEPVNGESETIDAVIEEDLVSPVMGESVASVTVTYPIEGTCGEGLSWSLDSDGVLTISGTGAMPEYGSESEVPWNAYASEIKSATIADGVTSIGNYAFYKCTALTSVTIGSGVTSIGICAFDGCSALTSVTMGSSVTSIGNSAFNECAALTGIDLSNVTSIAEYAFSQCKAITSITIPGAVKTIGECTFSNCGSLTSVTISEGVETIGENAFSDCGKLESVTIGKSVTLIKAYAFDECKSLRYAYYSGSKAEWDAINIKDGNDYLTAAVICKLTSGTCGDNLSWSLDSDGVLTISGTGDMADYAWNSSSGSNSAPWWTYNENIKTVEIADGVTSIGKYAFGYCRTIESVAIPDTVTKIGREAFKECEALKSVTIPDGVTSIEADTFYFCEALESVTIPDSVTKIGDNAFKVCTRLKNLTIGSSVESIGVTAFANCSALTAVTIPASVTSIGTGAFDSCTALTSVTIDDSAAEINPEAFTKCTALTNVDLGSKVTLIGEGAFSKCTALTAVTIPGSVTRIERDAFYKCTALTTVTIPASVTDIGENAFEYCYNLTDVYYYGSVVQWNSITIGDDNECLEKANKHFVSMQMTIDREYITMESRDEPVTLTVTVTPADSADLVEWCAENPDGKEIITVADGVITPNSDGLAGTAYAVAKIESNGEVIVSARCRVDVTAASTTDEITGVQLGTTSLTSELYSKDYAEFDILLLLKSWEDASEANENGISEVELESTNFASPAGVGESEEEDSTPDNTGVAITSARFTDPAAEAMFNLVVVDDRRIAVVPKSGAIDNPASVKSAYTSAVAVTVGDTEFVTDTKLRLTVKKTTPKLKATVAAFNSFYSGQSRTIEITGATVESIAIDTSKKNVDWLTLNAENLILTLNEDAPLKSASGSVYLTVYTEEWVIGIPVTLSVKNTYKAPRLKLSASSVKVSTLSSGGVEMQLKPSSKKETLEQYNVTELSASDGFTVKNFDRYTGEFTLIAPEGVKSGKITLSVGFGDTATKVSLKLSVQAATPTVKLKKSSVTLNPAYNDSVSVDMVITPADFEITNDTVAIEAPEGISAEVSSDGKLTVSALKGELDYSKTYKVTVSIPGTKSKAVLSVKTSKEGLEPSVTLKATGTLDITYPENTVVITPTFKNYGGTFTDYEGTVTIAKGKVILESGDIDDYFFVEKNGSVLTLTRKELDYIPAGCTYTITLTLKDAANGIEIEAKPVKLTLKQTAVNLKLSKSSISLNKKCRDYAIIGLSCSTKNYEIMDVNVNGTIKVTDKTGKITYDYDKWPLYVDCYYGLLYISVNENTEYGATYKVLVAADEGYKVSTITVKIPTEEKSTVTATVKAKGSIDTIRGESKIVFTPTYKNTLMPPQAEVILVYSSADNYQQPIYFVEGLELTNFDADTTLKYKAKVVALLTGEVMVETPLVSITVKTGTAKVKASGTPKLYIKDKSSRSTFTLTNSDETLNTIANVQIKDAKYAAMFELYNYGSGQYAIGFKGDPNETGAAKLTSASITLNIWHDGNETAKPDSTVTVKVTLVK